MSKVTKKAIIFFLHEFFFDLQNFSFFVLFYAFLCKKNFQKTVTKGQKSSLRLAEIARKVYVSTETIS